MENILLTTAEITINVGSAGVCQGSGLSQLHISHDIVYVSATKSQPLPHFKIVTS